MREVIEENQHLRLERDSERKVMWVIRSSSRPSSAAELAGAFDDIGRHIRPEHRSWGMVLDTRAAPGRNDADFEGGLRRNRTALARFARAVILVSSAAGQLQIQRLAREEGLSLHVAADEREAESLAAGDPP